RPALLFFEQQFTGAARRFHDRFDERDAKLAFLELENAVDGGSGGSSHGVFEKRWMIARFQHNACCALERLRCEKSRYVTRQTNFHAGFGQRLQNDVCEGGPACGKTRDRVHVLFIKDDRPANGIEHRANNIEMTRAGMSPTTNCCHATVDSGRSIWHCSHDW